MPEEQYGAAEAGRLIALVVTYNRLEQLQVTLTRLLESSPPLLERVVVVDNASTDGTGAWLASHADPRIEVISCATNTGGAGGFERGMREITARYDPDWLLLMDDDGRPAPGALAAFHASDPGQWDALAAAVYYPDGDICEMNRPSRNPFWHWRTFLSSVRLGGGRDGFHLSPEAYEKTSAPTPIDVTSFVGLFLSREAVARAGYPDGRLFVYGEDGLYTLALSAAGGRIVLHPAIRFEHDCRTLGKDRRFRPLWKAYYYHRNLLVLYRMAAGPVLFWPLLMVILPKWLLKARHHPGVRGPFLRLILRAVRDGLGRRTGTDHAALVAGLPAEVSR